VTVALTLSYSVGGFVMDGEETYFKETVKGAVTTRDGSGKIMTEKLTNKELLMAMNEYDQLDGTIVGWSIVMIDGQNLYAIKKNVPAVEVPVALSSGESPPVSAYSSKYTFNEDTLKETYTESGSVKTVGNVSSEFFMVELQGLATYSYKTVKGKLGTGDSAAFYGADNEMDAFYLGGASKLSGLSGGSTGGSADDYSLVEGSISFSAETVVDLDLIGVSGGI
jgi:hypothetical protein